MTKLNKFLTLATLAAIAVLALAACGGAPATTEASSQNPTAEPPQAPAEEPTQPSAEEPMVMLSGDVVVDGSSTVYPITTAVAEEFSAIYPDVRVSVGLSGTGGGFEKFCAGETDVSDASRPIKDAEKEACAASGIEYAEFLVALDGLTVMVNPENDWLQCLSAEQLAQIFGVNSTITRWSDIDPTFPDEPILFFVPDPDSGTRDYMIEVLEKAIETEDDIRQDDNTTFSSDDNVLLDGIANETYALGFFGYAYYINNQDAVRAVAIQNKDGQCVLPSNETVQDGSYNPLSRPLFIYPNLASLREKPQVAEFVRFYFSPEGAPAIMSDVGYSLPPDGTFEANLALLDELLGQ